MPMLKHTLITSFTDTSMRDARSLAEINSVTLRVLASSSF
jgi:hypothetical protein